MTSNKETQTKEEKPNISNLIPDTQNKPEPAHEENQQQQTQNETEADNSENNEVKDKSDSKQKTKKSLKKPPNSYVLFCSEHRNEVQQKNPTFSAMEVTKTLSQMWKELDKQKVDEYKNRAKELYELYKKENPDYRYKMNNKSSEKMVVRVNQKDAFQIVNHLFQTSPFILQQMLLEKDKGHLDITKMLSQE